MVSSGDKNICYWYKKRKWSKKHSAPYSSHSTHRNLRGAHRSINNLKKAGCEKVIVNRRTVATNKWIDWIY